jgi:mono/diheme cytochrome c family protein
MNRRLGWIASSLLAVGLATFVTVSRAPAQDQANQSAKPEIKTVPAANVNPSSGREMYMAYCASCHGSTGTGNGPAAPALKTAPTDLTQLAKKNGGKFPDAKVQQAIKGDPDMPSAHGSQGMPVWGPIFLSLGQRNQAQTQLRIHNLTNYLASIQQK